MLFLAKFGFLGAVTAESITRCKPLKDNNYFLDNCTNKIKDIEHVINNGINVETDQFDKLAHADVHEKRILAQVPLEPQPNKTYCIVKPCTANSTDFVIEGGHSVSEKCATKDDSSIDWDKHTQDSCKCGQHTCRLHDLDHACYPDEINEIKACQPEWHCPVHDEDNVLKCKDNTTCNPNTDEEGWSCCGARGGRLQCPKNAPFMCNGGLNPNVCGGDYCCVTHPYRCFLSGLALLQQCPTPKGEKPELCPISKVGATGSELICKDGTQCSIYFDGEDCCSTHKGIRQCPASAPVMCANDFGCAKVANSTNATDVVLEDHCCKRSKEYCANYGGILETCPVVPKCAGDEVWETTFVGGVARATCGQSANGTKLTGVKYRFCNSTVGDEVGKAAWTKVFDHCKPEQQKCKNVGHDNVPFLDVNTYMIVVNKNCTNGQKGYTKYACEEVVGAQNGKHNVSSVCQDPCACENGGMAYSFLNEESMTLGCACLCDWGFTGPKCEKREDKPVLVDPSGENGSNATTDKEVKMIILIAIFGMVLLSLALYAIVKYMCRPRQGNEDPELASDDSDNDNHDSARDVEDGNMYTTYYDGLEPVKC